MRIDIRGINLGVRISKLFLGYKLGGIDLRVIYRGVYNMM